MLSLEFRKKVCMIAYTQYLWDARVRREAEALARYSEFEVVVLSLKESDCPRRYTLDRVMVNELNVKQYRGKSTFK